MKSLTLAIEDCLKQTELRNKEYLQLYNTMLIASDNNIIQVDKDVIRRIPTKLAKDYIKNLVIAISESSLPTDEESKKFKKELNLYTRYCENTLSGAIMEIEQEELPIEAVFPLIDAKVIKFNVKGDLF